MRILVYGSRSYSNSANFTTKISAVHVATPAEIMVDGGCRPTDVLARQWAVKNGVPTISLNSYLSGSFGAAGAAHNSAMLRLGNPGTVVIFGDPTQDGEVADMIQRCKDLKLTYTQQTT